MIQGFIDIDVGWRSQQAALCLSARLLQAGVVDTVREPQPLREQQRGHQEQGSCDGAVLIGK